MKTRMLIKCLLAAAGIAAVFPAPVNGDTVPALWGVDKKDGQLFSFDDYRNPVATFNDYGRLQYWKDGKLKNVDRHIEAFTISPAGVAYMAVDHKLGGFDDAVLVSLDLNDVSTDGPNVIDLVGQLDLGFDKKKDSVTGLSFDPISGDLFALVHEDGKSSIDRLVVIDELTGALLSEVGFVSGLGHSLEKGEDLVFDQAGNLYVTDDEDDHLYQVDRLTGEILAVVDANEAGGLDQKSVKFEALAWDPFNNHLIGMDDKHELLVQFVAGSGGNIILSDVGLLGLGDVEGMAFIPEPSVLPMLIAGMIALIGWRGVHIWK